MRIWFCLSVIFLMVGCASSRGFNRGDLRERLSGPVVVNDGDIAKALATKAQLPKPFKVGVFFKDPKSRNHDSDSVWTWTAEDKKKILEIVQKKKTDGEISDAFVISDATVGDTDLKSLRLAAARHGADALLVVSGVNDLDRYTNNWSWTYIVIVPTLFVPGTVNDSLFMARAAMWDVRNEFLYLTAESESMKRQTRPAAYADIREVTLEAKTEAVNLLGEEISKMLTSMETHQSKPKSTTR